MTEAPNAAAPQQLSLTDAYERIRRWYQDNVDHVSARDPDYRDRSVALIRALPLQGASTLEIRAIFEEVLTGLLEWGSGESDGESTMSSYARTALSAANLPIQLSDGEAVELTKSPLWPFLTRAHRTSTDSARSRRRPVGAREERPQWAFCQLDGFTVAELNRQVRRRKRGPGVRGHRRLTVRLTRPPLEQAGQHFLEDRADLERRRAL